MATTKVYMDSLVTIGHLNDSEKQLLDHRHTSKVIDISKWLLLAGQVIDGTTKQCFNPNSGLWSDFMGKMMSVTVHTLALGETDALYRLYVLLDMAE